MFLPTLQVQVGGCLQGNMILGCCSPEPSFVTLNSAQRGFDTLISFWHKMDICSGTFRIIRALLEIQLMPTISIAVLADCVLDQSIMINILCGLGVDILGGLCVCASKS